MKAALWRIVRKYGLTGSALVVALILILYFTKNNPLINARYSDIFVLLVFVFFSIKEFRDVENRRILHFWQGITVGAMVTFAIAAISSACIWLLTSTDPGLLEDYKRQKIEFVQDNREALIESIDERAYTETIAGLESTTAADLTADEFLKKTLIGLFLAIIISVILRKNPL